MAICRSPYVIRIKCPRDHSRYFDHRYREKVASAGCSGCDILLGLRGGVLRRLCWLLVVAFLVGLTLREWARVFGEYDQYRVYTSVHYDTQASLPFPDVTVCNVNPLRRSALCKDRQLARREGLPDRVWWRECAEPATYYEPNLEDAALQSELWLWMARKKRLNRSVVRTMGHQLRHMLIGCRLGNNDCMQARPNADCAGTLPRTPPYMAVTALRGYDPTTLAWKNVPASTPEDSVPPTDIVDEGLFTVMTLRKRRQQSNTAKASDTDKAKSAKTPPKKTSRVSWRPAAMPRTAAEDFTIVLKPRVTVDLKAAFQPGELGAKLASYANATNSDCISVWPIWAQNIIVVSTNDINTANLLSREFSLKTSQGPLPMIGHAKISGEVCRGVITVQEQETSSSLKAKIHWRGGNIAFIRKLGKTSVALLTFEGHHVPRFVHYNSVVTPVREYKRTIPACYCCGTVGHRPELCPHPNDQRCGHCGQVVGASEEGMTPHECKPSCLVCGEEHLTGSPACKAKFRRLQQTGGQHGGRGSPQQRPKPKTSDVTPEGRQPGATNQTTKTNQQVPHPPKTSQASQKTSSKTPDQGAPVFQAGEFPPLTSGGAPRHPAKKTSSQVGSWAGAASSSHSPSPTSSPEFLVLKQELAALRAQNAQLLVKIATL
ncbi:hypothetical protein HPB49_022329 [Dermacentor silvarum]|uniref:Uncharacterized protein n=1 Tax=Dermacentor silvarum TaxID=543639 RepID=A0ACB8D064_DERSI|nr:hypothetical protein HPB49_022329 [Dermacentor silvarum]